MKGRWNYYRRELSFVLILVMIVSLLSQMSQGAEAKTNVIDYTTEVIDYDSELITASPVSEITTLDTEPLRAGISILTDGVSELLSKDAISEGLFRTGISTITSKITASSTSFSVGYGSSTKTVTIYGKKGTLRVDRWQNAMWLTASVSGSTVTINIPSNTSTSSRPATIEVTDQGGGGSVKIYVTQSGKPTPTPTKKPPTKTPTPTKKPTNTPTPTKKPTNTPTPTKKPTATPTPKLGASPTSLSFTSAKSSKTVSLTNVYGNSSIRVDRDQNATAFVTVSGSGSSYTVNVSANTSTSSRTGTITFTDTTNGRHVDVKITQSGAPTNTPTPTKKPATATPTPTKKPTATPTPVLGANPTSLSFTSAEGSKTVSLTNVYGNSSIRVDRDQNATAFVTVSGSGSSYTVKVSTNTKTTSRTGTITFTDTTNGRHVDVKVTQSGAPTPTPTAPLTANPATLSFTQGVYEKTVTLKNVYATSTIRVDKKQDAMGWVTVSGTGSSYTVKVTANKGNTLRTGTITFTDTSNGRHVDVQVLQAAPPTPTPTKPLKANPSQLSFTSEKSSKTITLQNVYSTSNIRVDRNQNAIGWVTVKGTGSSFVVSVSANTTGELRKGEITFSDTSNGRSVDVTIYQSNIVFCNISFDVTDGPKEQQRYMQTKTVVQGESLKGILPTSLIAPQYKQFDGWYDQREGGKKYTEKSNAPYKEELKLYAHWTYKNYTIVYDGNGADNGTMKNTQAKYGEWVKLSANQYIKTGKVFDGWVEKVTRKKYKNQESVMNVGDGNSTNVTLIAQWADPIYVTVTFDVNGGDESSLTQKKKTVIFSLEYGDLPTDLKHPDGMVFEGWQTADGTSITKSWPVTTTEDHTLYAKWRPGEYIIHFDGNGCISGTMPDITCKYGEEIKLPACTFDDGVMFDCWGTKKDGSGDNYKAKSNINLLGIDYTKKEITLYAIWKERLYTVEYYDGFTGELLRKDYKEDVIHKYMPMNGPAVEGLKFVGWSSKPVLAGYAPLRDNYENIVFLAGQLTVVTENVRAYAVYEVNKPNGADKIPVVFNLMGGKGGPSTMYFDRPDHSATYPLPSPTPTKDRYLFDGWATEVTAYAPEVVNKIEVFEWSDCIVLYARWVGLWTYVTLDFGYSGKTDIRLIDPDNPNYTFKDYFRPDYVLTGWKTSDGKIYKVGDTLEIPLEGLTVTAQWEKRKYTLKYFDSTTGKEYKTQILTSDQHILSTAIPIAGKVLDGWTMLDGVGFREVVPGALVSDVVDINDKHKSEYMLTSHYVLNNCPHNGFVVCYNLNAIDAKGGPTSPTYGDLGTGKAVLSTSVPERPGCKFLGWSRWKNGGGEEIQPGDTVDCSIRTEADYVEFYAIWGSLHSCTLNCNGVTNSAFSTLEIPDLLPGDEISLKFFKNIFGSPKGYTLLGWGQTPNEITYPVDGEFTVPQRDLVLYAIWAPNEYTLRLLDGFSGQEIDRVTVLGKQKVEIPDVAPNVPGYKFKGWAISYAYEEDPGYGRYSSIYLDEDIDLIAIYDRLPSDKKNFTIAYLPNGGEGGPGLVSYEPGEVQLSTLEPTREGYTFLGWAFANQNEVYFDSAPFPKGKVNKITGAAGDKYDLYAVWVRNSSNELKYELEDEYGPKAINDEFFDKKYESSDWEYINDRAYYVVRTKDHYDSFLATRLESTVMIMEFRNGSWSLRAKGTKEGFWDRIRLDILTSQTNTAVGILDTAFKIVDTIGEIGVDLVSVYCPAVGIVVNGMHFLEKAAECARKRDDYEFFEDWIIQMSYYIAEEEFTNRIKGTIDGRILGEALKKANQTVGLDEEAGKYFVDLFKTTEKALREEITSKTGNMDPFGNYDRAIELFQKRVKDQKFSQRIVDNVPTYINKIYEHVVY